MVIFGTYSNKYKFDVILHHFFYSSLVERGCFIEINGGGALIWVKNEGTYLGRAGWQIGKIW